MLKRIISFLSVFVILFPLVCVPANADTADDVGDSVGSFAEWLYRLSYPSESVLTWFKSKITSDGDSTAYSDYTADLDSSLGTYTVTNNGLRLYFNAISCSGSIDSFTAGNPFELQYTAVSTSKTRYVYFDTISLPFACTYDVGYSFTATTNVNVDNIYSNLASGTATAGTLIGPYGSSTNYIIIYPVAYASTATILFGSFYVDIVPVSGTVSDNTGVDVSSDTRAGSLTGDLMYVGDNGTQVAADDVTLFDESTGTVYNPSTNDSYNTTNWNYDYSDRSYHFTTDDSHTGKVVYGDDNASVTLTDSDGNTITYNYYYTVSGSSGSGSSGTSIWSKLGDLLGTVVDGFVSLVSTALSHLLDSLISLLKMVNEKLTTVLDTVFSLFDHIPSLFNGFTAFLAAVFPFIPQDIWDVLELGVCLLAAAAIIRFFLKR